MRRKLRKQWFLIALAAVLVVGFVAPSPLQAMAESNWLRNGIVAVVLFMTALPLETRVVLRTIGRPWAALLGSAVNMGLVPLLAWGTSQLLTGELATGVIVAAVAPTTLASAAVWTRRAGGNDAAAVLVTLLTNSTCFLTTPLWLSLLTRTHAELDVQAMIRQLGLLVVLPMTLAQLCRLQPSVARTATAARHLCATLAQLGILNMVLIGAVNCSYHLRATDWRQAVTTLQIVWMVGLVLALHVVALWIGFGLARSLALPRADQIAVAFAGSQKTLMVGLFVAINYFGGLAILPMVAYHVGQLFIDTVIADRWSQQHVVQGALSSQPGAVSRV
jgi:sodium/bile acid cotransporter 7